MSESIHDSYTRDKDEDDFNPAEEDTVRCQFCSHIGHVEDMEYLPNGWACCPDDHEENEKD